MEKVIQHLKEQERSVAWLGRQLGIKRTTLYYWTSGKKEPRRAYKMAIAQVLGQPYDNLFDK
tara:strand:- start:333 stop:518 length:186 start_codon:yes stop_codon:yes gene_type:complete